MTSRKLVRLSASARAKCALDLEFIKPNFTGGKASPIVN
jgi:hypothetical protein